MRIRRIIWAVFLASGTASAQLSETINVHLVEVPVTVVDRSGNPVRRLTAANFEILDQGKRREITNFDAIDFAQPESRRGISPLNPAARRSFLLLFDLSFSSPVGRTKAQDAARNFIARGLQRRDLAAIATVDVERGYRLLTAFTTDRNLLSAAVASPQTFVSSDPLRIAGGSVFDVSSAEPPRATSADANGVDEHVADVARLERRLNDSYNRVRVERQISQLASLGSTLRMLPGRKQVVFFSEGFDARLVQGRDARSNSEAMDDMQQTTSGSVWRVDPDARFGNSTTMTLLQTMARALRGSDVVMHTVDIQGVRVQNDVGAGAKLNSNEALYLLANSTGGEVFKNSNDFTAELQQMLERQQVVYVLGFRAASAKPGNFHELKMRLKDVPGGRLFHRSGYYEAGAESQIERSLSAAEVVLNDIAQTDVRIAALAAAIPVAHGNAAVPVIVEINGEDLLRDAKAGDVTAEVFLYAFDDEGIVRDRMFQHLSFDAAKTAERLRGGVKYFATLSLPPGRYAVKTLVRIPGSERKGFARTDVDVPAAFDVAVLPPLFLDQGRSVVVRGGSHDPSAPFPFHLNGEPFMPSAAVEVSGDAARRYAVFVYNAGVDEIDINTTLTDPAGKRRDAAPSLVSRLQGEDVIKLLYDLPPATLDAGSSRLDVAVHKKGSADTRSAGVQLLVRR